MKGIMERIHRLNYIYSVECSDDIIFPRVKRRLLQLNEETENTFLVPTIEKLEIEIKNIPRRSEKMQNLLKLSCLHLLQYLHGSEKRHKRQISQNEK